MLDGGLTVLDGTHLRALDLCLSDSDVAFNGAQVLELAESKATSSLFGFLLPENLKSSALKRLDIDDAVSFRGTELDHHQASSKLNDYVTAIADELKDDPIVVSILDGHTLRLFLEDEDDFAMLAENLFTDLDTEDKGKINNREIRNALVHMGVEMGVPPFSVFPQLNDILTKHEGEGEGEEVGQAQFAALLQPVLQDLADALSEKNVVVVQNVKIINGSKLRKVLADETQFNEVVEKIVLEKKSGKEGQKDKELIRNFLDKNGTEIGLPSSNANEAVVLLYDAVFADLDDGKDEIRVNVKEILEKFAEQLDANPVFLDLDN